MDTRPLLLCDWLSLLLSSFLPNNWIIFRCNFGIGLLSFSLSLFCKIPVILFWISLIYLVLFQDICDKSPNCILIFDFVGFFACPFIPPQIFYDFFKYRARHVACCMTFGFSRQAINMSCIPTFHAFALCFHTSCSKILYLYQPFYLLSFVQIGKYSEIYHKRTPTVVCLCFEPLCYFIVRKFSIYLVAY